MANTMDARMLLKRSTVAGVVPTVPASNDHTDGTWIATDIYKGELFYNQADNILYTRDDNAIRALCGYTPCDTRCASLTITSAQVLALNSTPLTIVAAQGAGTAIEVISASVKTDFNSAAYATNTTLQLICSGADAAIIQGDVLGATVSKTSKVPLSFTSNNGDTQILENADLQVSVLNGNPTAGDSDITVYVLYRVINI